MFHIAEPRMQVESPQQAAPHKEQRESVVPLSPRTIHYFPDTMARSPRRGRVRQRCEMAGGDPRRREEEDKVGECNDSRHYVSRLSSLPITSPVDLFVQQIKARESLSEAKEEHRNAKAKLKESQAHLDKLREERTALETKRLELETYGAALENEKRLLLTPLAERPLGGKMSMDRVRCLVLPEGQDPIPYLFGLSRNDLRTFLESLRVFGLSSNKERMKWWEVPPHGINLMDWTRLVGWTHEDITWEENEETNQLATRACGCLGLRINADCSPVLNEDPAKAASKRHDQCTVS